ncbi:MAG: PQQ-dependent sugar dehydrogenase, partial [Bacteroidota bacterium]
MKKNYTIIIALLITFKVFAQPTISLSSFSTGYTLLSDIANCGDSRLFVTQQRGRIIICDSLGVKRTTPFLNLTSTVSSSGNERGLLGLAFHPNYKQNGYFYVNYTRQSDGATRVSRFSVNPADSNLALPNSELNLLTITQPATNHNGGNIEFGPDGFLYIGMGDGGGAGDESNNSQNKLLRLGKMLRIDVNGTQPYSVPTSNPFVGNAAYAPEIWSLGLRNPWKWSFDRITG